MKILFDSQHQYLDDLVDLLEELEDTIRDVAEEELEADGATLKEDDIKFILRETTSENQEVYDSLLDIFESPYFKAAVGMKLFIYKEDKLVITLRINRAKVRFKQYFITAWNNAYDNEIEVVDYL